MAQILGGLARGNTELGCRRSERATADDGDQQAHQIEGVELVVAHKGCLLLLTGN